jgi:hypothetical protein
LTGRAGNQVADSKADAVPKSVEDQLADVAADSVAVLLGHGAANSLSDRDAVEDGIKYQVQMKW